MQTEKLCADFSSILEEMINRRNKTAQKYPNSEALIAFLDSQIDRMEIIESGILILCQELTVDRSKQYRAYFNRGIQAGKLEARTGRPHPEYFYGDNMLVP
jgi:hypothetical protein